MRTRTEPAIQTDPFPAIVSSFGYSPLAPALWYKDARTTLEQRDLSLAQASNDALSAKHLRAAGVATQTGNIGDANCAFAFVFVLGGRVTLRETGKAPVDLRALDSACRYGKGPEVEWSLSHDAEIIEIVAGRARHAVLGLETLAPGSWINSHEDEDQYITGEGPRSYFRYRDLRVAAATGRRIHIHIVRATQSMEGGTGWHSHSMGQLFYVLRGWADLRVERQPSVRMVTGDAMCVHPRLRHNVPAFSADYLVLEMCVPADYDTVDSDPP